VTFGKGHRLILALLCTFWEGGARLPVELGLSDDGR
jgi:hypothetical protein